MADVFVSEEGAPDSVVFEMPKSNTFTIASRPAFRARNKFAGFKSR